MKLFTILRNIIKGIENAKTYTDDTFSQMSDYVVEQGVSNGWTYRKWNSGFAECETTQELTLSGTGALWKTPIYGYTNIPRLSYPFTFAETPKEVVSAKGGVNAFWLYKQAGGDNSPTQAGLYALVKVDAFTNGSTANISYIVKGKIGGGN